MAPIRIAAVAAQFGRDLDFDLHRVASLIDDARRSGAALLVFPAATLGGCLADFPHDPQTLPPALGPDDHRLRTIASLAAEMVVCVGYHEAGGEHRRYSSAVCVNGDGVLGRHRKVHQSPGEAAIYTPGDRFAAFDTPVGRLGMMIDYDKAFPESARSLAVDGAEIVACLSAWPANSRSPSTPRDRQSRLFDLYDCVRAAENQIVLASANQTGAVDGTRFLGQAKVVDAGGDVRARTGSRSATVIAELDVRTQLAGARRALDHLSERKPGSYLCLQR